MDIKLFVQKRYKVEFPIFDKIEVNGANADPIFIYLRQHSPLFNAEQNTIKEIPWNFTKFLVNNEGHVVGYYPPEQKPSEISPDIEKLVGPVE